MRLSSSVLLSSSVFVFFKRAAAGVDLLLLLLLLLLRRLTSGEVLGLAADLAAEVPWGSVPMVGTAVCSVHEQVGGLHIG